MRCRKTLRELTVCEEKIGLVPYSSITAWLHAQSSNEKILQTSHPISDSQRNLKTELEGEKSQHKDKTCTASVKAQRLKEALRRGKRIAWKS